jgi:BirA family transcriptional regulator, biotin operon repressor / biotin---[acetyl-CoA-carboxylase] ligase
MQLDPTAIEAGVRLETLAAIGSTNAEARLRVQRGERGPLWITATAQSAGRGRHGRTWISPPGNLYASLLLHDPSSFEHAPQLAFVAALALRDAIGAEAAALAPQLTFKWPNDLLLAGDKCAGILIEGEAAFDGEEAQAPKRLSVTVGIGVNCTSHPSRSGGTESFPATDLQAHGAAITPAPLFRRLSATMCSRLAQWDRSHGFAAILADWLACAHGIGEQTTVRNNGGQTQGRFVGLDQGGRLLLELRNGTLTKISAGDVFPLAVHEPRRIADRPG